MPSYTLLELGDESMVRRLAERIRSILNLARPQDWRDTSFSLEKAQVCAELCAIVYEEIREYEIKKASRIHLFASREFRELLKAGKPNHILPSLAEGGQDGDQFFLVPGRYAVILGVKMQNVIFLAIRGTVLLKLWDWKANIDARRLDIHADGKFLHKHNPGALIQEEEMYFHRGFFEGIAPQFPSIIDQIGKLKPSADVSIVWTGHSLGGAMAAIGNAITDLDYEYSGLRSREGRHQNKNVAAYTFGMPRYGSLGAVCYFSNPYHIYDERDLVPTLPLRSMGFVDSAREYVRLRSGMIESAERTDTLGALGHLLRVRSSLKAHFIEGYADSIASALGGSRP